MCVCVFYFCLQERDPVERVKKLLLAKNYDAAAIKAIEKSVKKEVDTAVEESKVCRQRVTCVENISLGSYEASTGCRDTAKRVCPSRPGPSMTCSLLGSVLIPADQHHNCHVCPVF